jgi:branched-subunit amino acid ABC-type transport system permease component
VKAADSDVELDVSTYAGRSLAWIKRNGVLCAIGIAMIGTAVRQTDLFVVGLIEGTVLALGSLGLSITYGLLKFPNLGHGMIMVLGGYFAFFLYTGHVRKSVDIAGDITLPNLGALPGATQPLWGLSFGYGLALSLLAAAIVVAGLAVLIDWLVYQRFRQRKQTGPLTLAIVSFGVTYVLVAVVDIIWGLDPRNITFGISLAQEYPFGILLKTDYLVVFAAAVVFTGGAYYFLYRTRLGIVMRAMSDNPNLALVSGIDVDLVIRYTWLLVGLLTGAAGTLQGLVSPLNPELGVALLLPLFAAALLGGIGSPLGSLIGGLLVGVAQTVSVAVLDPGYQIGVAFMIMVLVLLFRPTGLLGAR